VGARKKGKTGHSVITDFGVGWRGKEPENSKAVGPAGWRGNHSGQDCPVQSPLFVAQPGSAAQRNTIPELSGMVTRGLTPKPVHLIVLGVATFAGRGMPALKLDGP